MPRKPQPWFRFYVEAFNDRKILRLTHTQRWLWVSVLGAARESPEPGTLLVAEGEPMTHDELARYADVPKREVAPALALMERLKMIEHQDGVVVVLNWPLRQFESDNVTERTRAYRERSYERAKEQNGNVRGNPPETETETETDKDSYG